MASEQFESNLTPIWITVTYDPQLRAITGRAEERSMVDEGCPFYFILQCLLMDHPIIEKRYPPGVLGITLNGHPPDVFEPLKDGDQINFMICDNPPFVQ